MIDHDKPDEHETTYETTEYGGPYHVVINVAGKTVFDDVVRKDDRMDVYTTPLGDVDDHGDDLKDVARDMYEHGDYSVREIAVHFPATIEKVREWVDADDGRERITLTDSNDWDDENERDDGDGRREIKPPDG